MASFGKKSKLCTPSLHSAPLEHSMGHAGAGVGAGGAVVTEGAATVLLLPPTPFSCAFTKKDGAPTSNIRPQLDNTSMNSNPRSDARFDPTILILVEIRKFGRTMSE